MAKVQNLLIDGDAFNMNVAFAMEKMGASTGDIERNVLKYLESILEPVMDAYPNVSSCDIIIYGKNNFRYDIPTTRPYKGNRKKSKKPYFLEPIREWEVKNLTGKVHDIGLCTAMAHGEEADDMLGRLQTLHMNTSVICGVDKDLMQIPGHHMHMKTHTHSYVSWSAALRNFFKQCLSGDPGDNIPGIPGIGQVKADKLVPSFKDTEDLYTVFKTLKKEVFNVYKDYIWDNIDKVPDDLRKMMAPEDLAKDMMNENAQLLWIRKHEWKEWDKPPLA